MKTEVILSALEAKHPGEKEYLQAVLKVRYSAHNDSIELTASNVRKKTINRKHVTRFEQVAHPFPQHGTSISPIWHKRFTARKRLCQQHHTFPGTK